MCIPFLLNLCVLVLWILVLPKTLLSFPTSNHVLQSLQARIAEEAGAAAVMALERVPADIRVQGGVARMSDPAMIKGIMDAVTIPVMAKARIGHFVECQVWKYQRVVNKQIENLNNQTDVRP